tara:strand:- start:941 stop:2401 length:1461 start_codon:yes stop_codon:yes gene_type:complete
MGKSIKLSKSRIVDGITCEKKAHLAIHQPELKAPVTPAKQYVFDQGHRVGRLAQEQFPGGYLVKAEYWDTQKAVKETLAAISIGTNAIFEATFSAGPLHCKVDILHRDNSQDKWHIIEVKSGVSAKPEYVIDAAIQAHILSEAGIEWNKVSIMHLNKECRAPNLSNLLTTTEVTDLVRDHLEDLPGQIASVLEVVNSKHAPSVEIGRYCEKPYECDFKKHCFAHVPDSSVFDLPLGWKLFDKGYLKIEDIDPSNLTPTQKIPYEVTVSGRREINSELIRETLKKWDRPFYHLDFETIGPAIPIFPGTGPFNNTPMQFSLHIQGDIHGEVKHFEYLHPDETEPRRAVAEKLVEWIPSKGGTVTAFNSSFEAKVLRQLAEMFPDLSDDLLAIEKRLVDPQDLIRNSVYDKEFRGSFSLKEVAPALLGPKWSYANLEVSDGKAAQRAFEKMILSDTADDEKAALKKSLLEYCAQDTLAMVELLNWLGEQ